MYQPRTWRQNDALNLQHAIDMMNQTSALGNYSASTDPEYDYINQAEELAHQTNQLQKQATEARANRVRQALAKFKPEITTSVKTRQVRRPVRSNQGNRNNGPVAGRGNAHSNNRLQAFINAIASQESGGNYGAVNSDSGAAGKYQIMPANFTGPGGWDKEALGRDITLQGYLNHPRVQEKIARNKLTDYFNKYGAAGAASAWYSGSPSNWNSTDSQGNYPSIHAYVLDILHKAGLA